MKVIEAVESAAHVCVLLAFLPRGTALPAAKLAEFHELSATSIAKQLQQLASVGLVTGTKGRTGGYRLAKPAAEITMLDIVRAVDGESEGFQCHEIRQNGPCAGEPSDYPLTCGIHSAMQKAEIAWRMSLAKTNLLDIAKGVSASLPKDVAVRGQAWMEKVAR